MSISFALSLTENISKEETFKKCEEINSHSPDLAVKLMTFVLDKDYGKNLKTPFCYCFLWLYINNLPSFYKNLSHIVGVYNTKTFDIKKIKNLMTDAINLHDEELDNLISKDYQKTFRESWDSQSRKIFFDEVIIPEYSQWNILLIVFDTIKEHFGWSDKKAKTTKLYFVIINLISSQLDRDKISLEKEGYISHCVDILKETHVVVEYIKYIKNIKNIKNLKNYKLRKKNFINKQQKYAFDFRYKFVTS
jgi:hypothetical protein